MPPHPLVLVVDCTFTSVSPHAFSVQSIDHAAANATMDPMDKVRSGMKNVKMPGVHDIVYKDECMFCFDTPFSPGALSARSSTHACNAHARKVAFAATCLANARESNAENISTATAIEHIPS